MFYHISKAWLAGLGVRDDWGIGDSRGWKTSKEADQPNSEYSLQNINNWTDEWTRNEYCDATFLVYARSYARECLCESLWAFVHAPEDLPWHPTMILQLTYVITMYLMSHPFNRWKYLLLDLRQFCSLYDGDSWKPLLGSPLYVVSLCCIVNPCFIPHSVSGVSSYYSQSALPGHKFTTFSSLQNHRVKSCPIF